MAKTVFPTKGWQWPDTGVTASGPYVSGGRAPWSDGLPEHDADCPGRDGFKGICDCRLATASVPGIGPLAGIDQLRRDRDELVAALEAEHERFEGACCRVYDDEPGRCPVCALLARVKAGK